MKKAPQALIKDIRTLLRDRKARDDSGKFIAEGEKAVADLLRKEIPVELILCSTALVKETARDVFRLADNASIPVYSMDSKSFEKISALCNSQGILALVKKPSWHRSILTGERDKLVVALDGVQDPGNMGSILRTSAAFGVSAVIIFGNSVDIFNQKVVRAASGTVADIPVFTMDMAGLEGLKKDSYRFYVAGASFLRAKPISVFKAVKGKTVLIFGSEGRGVSEELTAIADELFYIPIDKRVESLNVLSAASISIFHFTNINKS